MRLILKIYAIALVLGVLSVSAAAQVSWLPGYTVFAEGDEIDYPVTLSDAQWHSRLTDDQFYILRQKGTEFAFSGVYDKFYQKGTYYSAATGQPLFKSNAKFNSRTGWPSFFAPVNRDALVLIEDSSLFMQRIEVVDSLSGSHLGHVFPDGPAPTGLRFCINSDALIFVPEGGTPPDILQGE